MKQTKFQRNCKTFEKLIKEGDEISKGARSFTGGNYISDAEQRGHMWYIKTRNFLAELFGENFRDLNTFKKCFGKYTQKSLYTESYMGSVRFVKEDMEKGVGVLKGIYSSFKNGQIKKINKLIIALINFYHEIKDWGKISAGIIKKTQ